MMSIIPLIFSNTPIPARWVSPLPPFERGPRLSPRARFALIGMAVVICAVLITKLAGARGGEAVSAQGIWTGQYGCAQGMTGLTLTVGAVRKSRMRAVFHFYPDPSEPSVPEGCFEMEGTYDSLSGHMDLRASKWIMQPEGYVTVDLSGEVSPGGDAMAGSVIGPSCTKFALRRAAASARGTREACPSKSTAVSVR